MIADYGRLFRATEAARQLGMDRDMPLFRRLVSQGQITSVRHSNGRLIGVYERHLADFQRDHVVATPMTTAREGGGDAIDQFMPKTLVFPI